MAPRTDPWSLFPALSAKRWLQKAPRDVQIVRLFKLHEKCRAHFFSVPTSEDEISELKRFGWVFIPEIQFPPQHGFLGNFFSRKDSKKPEFFGGFWRRKIPEKITFQGCSPTGGKFGRFFFNDAGFSFWEFLGKIQMEHP